MDTTAEELGKLADEEGVTILPTFKFYREGQEVRHLWGLYVVTALLACACRGLHRRPPPIVDAT